MMRSFIKRAFVICLAVVAIQAFGLPRGLQAQSGKVVLIIQSQRLPTYDAVSAMVQSELEAAGIRVERWVFGSHGEASQIAGRVRGVGPHAVVTIGRLATEAYASLPEPPVSGPSVYAAVFDLDLQTAPDKYRQRFTAGVSFLPSPGAIARIVRERLGDRRLAILFSEAETAGMSRRLADGFQRSGVPVTVSARLEDGFDPCAVIGQHAGRFDTLILLPDSRLVKTDVLVALRDCLEERKAGMGVLSESLFRLGFGEFAVFADPAAIGRECAFRVVRLLRGRPFLPGEDAFIEPEATRFLPDPVP